MNYWIIRIKLNLNRIARTILLLNSINSKRDKNRVFEIYVSCWNGFRLKVKSIAQSTNVLCPCYRQN